MLINVYISRSLISIRRHIMTAIAAYINLTWGIWLRYCLKGRQDDVELVWPSLFTSVPVVMRTDKAKPNHLHENGLKKTN
jgi:Ceramidase